jgi:hypothetical protein
MRPGQLSRYSDTAIFGRFRKSVSVVVFSRSSGRVEQLDSHWMDFDEV